MFLQHCHQRLSVLHSYFDDSTKFLVLISKAVSKFLDILAKKFFSCKIQPWAYRLLYLFVLFIYYFFYFTWVSI